MDVAWLRSTEGGAAITEAARLLGEGRDPLAVGTALRASGTDADRAAAALTQATLRERAVAKFGPRARRMLFTRAGLEQATRAVVADRRAARLAAAGAGSVADLGCGIGADAMAFHRAGLFVRAVEADPVTAAIAAANLGFDVHCADATAVDLSDVDAAFCDPARRDVGRGRRTFDPKAYSPPWSFVEALPTRRPMTVLKLAPGIDHDLIPAGAEAEWVSVDGDVGRGRRTFDPKAYSPPWSFVEALPTRRPMTVLKLAPGIDHDLIPAGAEAEWVSVDGDVVEAAVWCGPLAEVPRRASVLRGDRVDVLTGTGAAVAPVAPPSRFLYDPDGAVVRAHLVAEFATTVDGTVADERIAYVFSDTAAPTPFARCFEVVAPLPAARKQLRAALREHDVGRLEIRKRGVAVDPDELRRDLRLSGGGSATLVLTRLGQRPVTLLCRPVATG